MVTREVDIFQLVTDWPGHQVDNQYSLASSMHIWDDLLSTMWCCDGAVFVREINFSVKVTCLK